jgi:hypothetical protein
VGTSAHRLPLFQKQERRQRTPSFDAPGGHELWRLKDVDRGKIAILRLAFVNVSQRGIRGAEVDADLHPF